MSAVVRVQTGTVSDGFGNTNNTSINAVGGSALLIIGTWRANDAQTASITWNGVPIDVVVQDQGGAPFGTGYIIGRVIAPAQVTADAVITTVGTGQRMYVMGYVLSDTDAATPVGAASTPVTDASAALTSVTGNPVTALGASANLAIDVLVSRDGAMTGFTPGAGQTQADAQGVGEVRLNTSYKSMGKGTATTAYSWAAGMEYKYVTVPINSTIVPPPPWNWRDRASRPAPFRPGRVR